MTTPSAEAIPVAAVAPLSGEARQFVRLVRLMRDRQRAVLVAVRSNDVEQMLWLGGQLRELQDWVDSEARRLLGFSSDVEAFDAEAFDAAPFPLKRPVKRPVEGGAG